MSNRKKAKNGKTREIGAACSPLNVPLVELLTLDADCDCPQQPCQPVLLQALNHEDFRQHSTLLTMALEAGVVLPLLAVVPDAFDAENKGELHTATATIRPDDRGSGLFEVELKSSNPDYPFTLDACGLRSKAAAELASFLTVYGFATSVLLLKHIFTERPTVSTAAAE